MIGKLDSLCRGTRGIDDRWWKDSHAAMARGCTTWKATGRRAFDLSHLDTSKGRTYAVATERIILMTEWEGVVYACTDNMQIYSAAIAPSLVWINVHASGVPFYGSSRSTSIAAGPGILSSNHHGIVYTRLGRLTAHHSVLVDTIVSVRSMCARHNASLRVAGITYGQSIFTVSAHSPGTTDETTLTVIRQAPPSSTSICCSESGETIAVGGLHRYVTVMSWSLDVLRRIYIDNLPRSIVWHQGSVVAVGDTLTLVDPTHAKVTGEYTVPNMRPYDVPHSACGTALTFMPYWYQVTIRPGHGAVRVHRRTIQDTPFSTAMLITKDMGCCFIGDCMGDISVFTM